MRETTFLFFETMDAAAPKSAEAFRVDRVLDWGRVSTSNRAEWKLSRA